MRMCVMCMQMSIEAIREGIRAPGIEVANGCGTAVIGAGINLEPLKEQQVLLIIAPPLQP